MVKYVYEVIEATDYGKNNLDLDVGKILIKSEFYGFYHDMAIFQSKEHNFVRTGRMHYLFKLFADTKKQPKKAVKEIEEKLAKKRAFITRDIYEENKENKAS